MIGQQERARCDRCGRELMTTPSGTIQCPDPACRDSAPDAGELLERLHDVTLDKQGKPCAKVMRGMAWKIVPRDDLTPMRAIRLKCIDCSGGNLHEASNCPLTDCPLWKYRTGKTGRTGRRLTDEERQAASERLRQTRPR